MKNMVFSLVQERDYFLVVEIGFYGARITKMLVDFNLRSIEILEDIIVDVNDNLADIFKKIDNGRAYIILILDAGIGFTTYSKILLSFPTEGFDFEGISAEALQKFFVNIRSEAAHKLGIDSADVSLLDARILGVSSKGGSAIIGSSLSNLTGEIEMDCTLTCVAQKWAEGIFKILPINRVVMCVEGVVSFGRVVAHVLKDQSFIFSYISSNKTTALEINGCNINYLDYFSCGTETIFNELALQSRFPKNLIKHVVNSYCIQLGSATFLDKFGSNLNREYKIIENGLKVIAGKSSMKFLYIASCEALPNFMIEARIKNRSRHFMKIFTVSNSFISEKLGFEVKYKVEEAENHFQIVLASLFDFYLSPKQELFFKIVKNRLKWIVRPNEYVS